MPARTIGPVEEFMWADHRCIATLLAGVVRPSGAIDAAVYSKFRQMLLRHIAMEDEVLLTLAESGPAGSRTNDDRASSMAAALREDHRNLRSLLMAQPTASLCAELRDALDQRDGLEERTGNLYAMCDELAGREAPQLVERLRRRPAGKASHAPQGWPRGPL